MPGARGLSNAALRRAQREGNEFRAQLERNPVIRTPPPRWLQKRLKAAWPDQWESICPANNPHPPMTLRVNRLRGTRDRYLTRLREAGIEASPCRFSVDGLTLQAPRDVHQLPGFAEGEVSVQDEAAQLAAPLLDLKAGQRVLDACCAPGGKTCHILELEPGLSELVALDLEPSRLERVRENLQRDRQSTRLNSSHVRSSYAVFCLKKKNHNIVS